jgi:hypothetical protein
LMLLAAECQHHPDSGSSGTAGRQPGTDSIENCTCPGCTRNCLVGYGQQPQDHQESRDNGCQDPDLRPGRLWPAVTVRDSLHNPPWTQAARLTCQRLARPGSRSGCTCLRPAATPRIALHNMLNNDRMGVCPLPLLPSWKACPTHATCTGWPAAARS